MKKILVVFGIVLLIIAGMILYVNLKGGRPFGQGATAKVNDRTIELELAQTDEERQIGLSDHESLGENSGMLFLFEEPGDFGFWMRNMNFPIDIIFIRENAVVTIFENAQPPRENSNLQIYKPDEPADKVLEVNAGKAEEFGIKEGSTLEFTL